MQHIHALTPGDHFSPLTGSAIATVVDGLSQHTQPRPRVLVARGTYSDRYGSADVIEYELRKAPHGAPRSVRGLDVLMGSAGLPRPWARAVYAQALESQESWQPSIVMAHNAPQMVPVVRGKHFAVLYAHNDLLGWYNKREARRVLGGVEKIVSVSQFTAEQLADKIPSFSDRIRVVHNGVDVERFAPRSRSDSERLRVGFLGRVIESKGAHVLLEALCRLRRDDIEAVIIGSSGFDPGGRLSPYEQELRGKAAGVAGGVRFLPFQARRVLPEVLGSLDVLVVPSVWPEPFGLTVLEGMASGLAVVASNVGGIPEASAGAAWLVSPGHVEELAEALEALVESPDKVKELGDRGRERALSRTWRHAATDLNDALRV